MTDTTPTMTDTGGAAPSSVPLDIVIITADRLEIGALTSAPLTLLLPALFFARAAAAGAPAPDMPAAVLRWGTRALIALSGLLIVFGTAGALASIARHWRGYGPPFGCHAT